MKTKSYIASIGFVLAPIYDGSPALAGVIYEFILTLATVACLTISHILIYYKFYQSPPQDNYYLGLRMANVHRLGDFNNNNNNNNYGRAQQANNAFSNQPLLGGMGNQQFQNPRQESFGDMLKFTFCPTFTIKSFIFFITIADVLIYIFLLLWNFLVSKC